jgi:hypothetical protein
LRFRLGAQHGDAVASTADPFVIASVFLIMEEAARAGEGLEVEVHGTVSPSLIRNLDEFQIAWSTWNPELYGRAAIYAEDEREASEGPSEEKAVMCFSGGLDSAFTAYRHARPDLQRFPRRLCAGVMVQGMEFDLQESQLYERAEERAQRMLDSLGVPLIRMEINYRDVIPQWWYSHGAAVAACLSLLQRRFNVGLIAQTMTYGNNHLKHEGVNPTTDWLLSSDSFRMVPDGAGHQRFEKILALKDWPELLEHLRVCWAGGHEKAENCCRCDKCVKTILHFRVLGLGLPPCFPRDVPDEHISSMTLKEDHMSMTYDGILDLARRNGIEGSWVTALDRCVRRNRRHQRSKVRRYARRFRAKAASLMG